MNFSSLACLAMRGWGIDASGAEMAVVGRLSLIVNISFYNKILQKIGIDPTGPKKVLIKK